MADGFYTEHVSAGVLSEPSLDRVRTREEEHVTAELACAARGERVKVSRPLTSGIRTTSQERPRKRHAPRVR